ncbi:MAG: hypothetical protein QOE15_376, partial [Acidimicrobiaceae bacterium]|nr:hypothetical protein [Acidimicrobiaceae bacterium]
MVAQARTGDVGAFGHIVDHYDRRLRALAYRLLGERDLMDDVLQEVYVKAFRALPRFKGDASLGTWLFHITYNTCIDELRGNRKVVRLFADGSGCRPRRRRHRPPRLGRRARHIETRPARLGAASAQPRVLRSDTFEVA